MPTPIFAGKNLQKEKNKFQKFSQMVLATITLVCVTGLLAPSVEASITTAAQVNQPDKVHKQSINLTVKSDKMTANFKAVPIRTVLKSIASQTPIKFYLDRRVNKNISFRATEMPLERAISKITHSFNTALIWVSDRNKGKQGERISAVHILAKGSESAVLETIETISNATMKAANKQARLKQSNVPGAQSIYEPRPTSMPRQYIKEVRNGMEVAYVSDELLIRIDPKQNFNNTIRWLNGIVHQHHGVLAQRMHRMRYLVARFAANVNIQQVKKELLKEKVIQVAEPNYVAKIAGTITPSKDWYLKQIHIPQASGKLKPSRYPIAIIDTGVDYNVAELNGMVIKGDDVINHDTDPMDDNGHGTAMALLAHKVAPNAAILAIKALDRNGVATNADIAEAIYRALDERPAVINLSLGGYAASQALQDAIHYANYAGVPVVAAAGNDGMKGKAFYPAAYQNVIAVGSVDQSRHVTGFSNQGDFVDLVAPGLGLQYSKNGIKAEVQGTSASSVLVAGSVARLKQHNYQQASEIISGRLFESADDIETNGKDQLSGYGILNLMQALNLHEPAHQYLEVYNRIRGNGASVVKTQFISNQLPFGASAGATSGWFDVTPTAGLPTGDFMVDYTTTTSNILLTYAAPLAIVEDSNGRVSISVSEFRCRNNIGSPVACATAGTVRQIRFHVMAGSITGYSVRVTKIKRLRYSPDQSTLPLSVAKRDFISTDTLGIRGANGGTGSAYNGLEYTGGFSQQTQNYLVAHALSLGVQLRNLPSHLLYSDQEYFYDVKAAKLVSTGNTSALGNRIPVILIHGWQGNDDKWAETLLTQADVEAWWDLAEHSAFEISIDKNNESGFNHNSFFETQAGFFNKYKVFRFRYPTGRSNQYNANILRDMINANQELTGRKDIIIIGHSTGGLIAKYMLLEPTTGSQMATKINKVITLATPHRGSTAGDDYDLDFGLNNATSEQIGLTSNPNASIWNPYNFFRTLGQNIARYNLRTDGAIDLAWDNGWHANGNNAAYALSVPRISFGPASGQYQHNTTLLNLNSRLELAGNKNILDKFIFYGGWIEVDGWRKAALGASAGCIAGRVGGIGCALGGVVGSVAALPFGTSGFYSNDPGQKGAATNMSYTGLDNDSVVSLASSLLLAPNESLSSLNLPNISIKQDFSISGNRRIFYDRDHTQMHDGVYRNNATLPNGTALTISNDPLFQVIQTDLESVPFIDLVGITDGYAASGSIFPIHASIRQRSIVMNSVSSLQFSVDNGLTWTGIPRAARTTAIDIFADWDISQFGLAGSQQVMLKVSTANSVPINIPANANGGSIPDTITNSDSQTITITVNNSGTGGGGTPIFSDLFNGTLVNTAKWNITGGNWGVANGQLTAFWSQGAAQTDQGNLLLAPAVLAQGADFSAQFKFKATPPTNIGHRFVLYKAPGNKYSIAIGATSFSVQIRQNAARYTSVLLNTTYASKGVNVDCSQQVCTAQLDKVGNVYTIKLNGSTLWSFTDTVWNGATRLGIGTYGTAIYNSFTLNSAPAGGIAAGLVAYYPFEGNANDASGNGKNGTVTGAPTYVAGVSGQAMNFTGTELVTANDPFPVGTNVNSPMAVSVWIKTNSAKQAAGVVTQFSACSNVQGDNFHLTLYNTPGARYLSGLSGVGHKANANRALIADNAWHHVAYVDNGTQSNIYIDGQLATANRTVGTVTTFIAGTPLAIGGFFQQACAQDHHFIGSIDEVRIYNRALSASEVGQLAGRLIGINLNAPTYTAGSTMTLTGTTVASTPTTRADIYYALQLPDSTLLVMQPDGTFNTALTPFQANVAVPNATSQLFNYTLTGQEPVGTYTWYAALMQPGTMNVIGTLATSTFTVR